MQVKPHTKVFISERELFTILEKAITNELKRDHCFVINYNHVTDDKDGSGIEVNCSLGAERSGQ